MTSRRPALGPGQEFDLIRSALGSAGPLPEHVVIGPGDDAAVLEIGPHTVISSDLSVEGVHFRSGWVSPKEVGYRAAAAALSDLAAMAADPVGILLSVGVDAVRASSWIPEVSMGASDAVGSFGCVLGGDVSRVPEGAPVVIDVVAVGATASAVSRGGARPGDEVWVTGELGLAAWAVRDWENGHDPNPEARHRFAAPTPRLREAVWLSKGTDITSMIDLSDGIVADAGHIAAASGVRIDMKASLLPVPEGLLRAQAENAMVLAATGGEDYELCFTAPAGSIVTRQPEFERHFGVRLTRVGVVTTGGGVGIVGVDLTGHRAGHDHFQPESSA